MGKLLQNARKRAGLTQQELCHKAGLSYSTLAKIERGAIKAPSIFTIQSIAATIGISLNDIMGEITPKMGEQPKKRSKSGLSFVYFDINGCLVRFYHAAFTKIAEECGKPADVIETTFWHYNDAVCRGEISLREFNESLSEQFNLPHFDWTKYYLDAIEPIEEMHDLVKWAAEHYRIGLLSNIMPGIIDKLIEAKLVPDVKYTSIIDSSEVKTIKPEAEIYEIAAEKAGVKPTEILLVDDSRANLMAAEREGWHVLWFDDYRPEESSARVRDALDHEA